MVNGKRVKTIDVHAHCIVPAAAAVINHPLEAPGLLMHDTSTRIAAMDAQGIDVEALSINPYWYRAERDAAAELIKIQNETLVRVLRRQARPLRRLRDRGPATSRAGRRAGRTRRQDSSASAASASAAASPARNWPTRSSIRSGPSARSSASSSSCTRSARANWSPAAGSRGSGLLTNTIGNPLETTIALSHLIFEGTLDRFPGLEDLCRARRRLPAVLRQPLRRGDPVLPDRVGPLPKKHPTAYLQGRQLYFDTIVFTPEALRHLIAETGPGQIMIGTDYPFPWTSTEVDLVLNTPGLSDDERIAILGGTAARLLGIAP